MNRDDTIRWGLARTREAERFALSRRDRQLPDLAEMRNFSIPGGDGAAMRVRLYVPMGAEPEGPILLYFHGGGFAAFGFWPSTTGSRPRRPILPRPKTQRRRRAG